MRPYRIQLDPSSVKLLSSSHQAWLQSHRMFPWKVSRAKASQTLCSWLILYRQLQDHYLRYERNHNLLQSLQNILWCREHLETQKLLLSAQLSLILHSLPSIAWWLCLYQIDHVRLLRNKSMPRHSNLHKIQCAQLCQANQTQRTYSIHQLPDFHIPPRCHGLIPFYRSCKLRFSLHPQDSQSCRQ